MIPAVQAFRACTAFFRLRWRHKSICGAEARRLRVARQPHRTYSDNRYALLRANSQRGPLALPVATRSGVSGAS
jgi:hypothetical protein